MGKVDLYIPSRERIHFGKGQLYIFPTTLGGDMLVSRRVVMGESRFSFSPNWFEGKVFC